MTALPSIKRCPFCNARMEIEEAAMAKNGRGPTPAAFRHPKNSCLLTGFVWRFDKYTEKWNRRATEPDAA